MVLGGYLEHSRDRRVVPINHMSDQLSNVLIDQDDVNVITLDETLEAIFDLTDWCVCKQYDDKIYKLYVCV